MNAFFDRFLSASLLAATPDVRRRARLVVAVALLLIAPVLLFSLQWIAQGDWFHLAQNNVAVIFYASALAILKKRGSLFWAANFIAGPMMLISLGFAFASGGFTPAGAATWPWATLAVLVSYLLGGRDTGRIWTGVYFVAMATAFIGGRQGMLPPSPPPGDDISNLVSISMLSLMLIGVTTFYERMNSHMLVSLDEAAKRTRLVLDNVGEGFLLVGVDGTMTPERSRAVEHWFGAGVTGGAIWDYLADDEHNRLCLRLGWEELVADVLPRDVLLEQMPSRVVRGERTFSLRYRVIGTERIESVVVVVRDVTLELAAKAAEDERVESAELFERVVRDADGFRAFVVEANLLVDGARSADPELRQRALHTLKGTAGFMGAQRVAAWCHLLEERLAGGDDLVEADHVELRRRLKAVEDRFAPILHVAQARMHVDAEDIEDLRRALHAGASFAALDAQLQSWTGEPVRAVFERLGEQARGLARRLGHGDLAVVVDVPHLRTPRGSLDTFAAACTHIIRNAVDHGMESSEERLAAGKSSQPLLRLSLEERGAEWVVRIADDGRGIQWDRLAEKAKAHGLPHDTPADLRAALFADGVSTRDTVTDISGRGVGMAAVKDTVERLGGTVDVDSVAGQGTTFVFRLPRSLAAFPTAERAGAPALLH